MHSALGALAPAALSTRPLDPTQHSQFKILDPMMLPETDPLGAALARLAGLLPQPRSPARLAELRAAAAAAVSTLRASPHAHGYPEAALKAAAALWVRGNRPSQSHPLLSTTSPKPHFSKYTEP